MLTIWWIGWLFTIGITGKNSFGDIFQLLCTWPHELGEYIRGKLE